MSDYAHILLFSQSIAREAGSMMINELRKQGGPAAHYKFAGAELVTEADIKVDKLICDAIRKQFPDHLILAEESAPDLADLSQNKKPLWIIDPIDGTVNYAHGHDQSAVSIAFAENGQVQCGVVFNPFVDEMFYAIRGQGAFMNGKSIQVAQKTEMHRALFATGFPYIKKDMALLTRRVGKMLEHCADLRRLGSAALDICWVAMGRLDIYYENLSVWDFAAAQLIAREAGARYGHFQPVPEGVSPEFHNQNILVANAALFEQAAALLQQADREA
ncbi:MAG TPA: inositol monophosphatase family protein [Pseudohongiella sp.]|nr:inositol monophosphatase family protein [Pseudohongiella sp.]